MKIGAYNINSQLNMYTPDYLSKASKIDNAAQTREIEKSAEVKQNVNLPLTGGDLFKPSNINKVTYDKFTPAKVSSESVRELDDFSLVSAKEDKIQPRFPNVDENVNYKEIISDDEMDNFLKKAFKLFDF